MPFGLFPGRGLRAYARCAGQHAAEAAYPADGRGRHTRRLWLAASAALAVMVLVQGLEAAPTNERQAERVVKGWLRSEPQPLAVPLGKAIQRVETYAGPSGQPAYFVVYLNPAGFVVVSADDQVEPIVAFAAEGVFDPSPANPLGALVSGDLPARVGKARSEQAAGRAAPSAARSKWERLSQDAKVEASSARILGAGGIADMRVAPLVASRWGQGSESGGYLYNYYTPNHWVVGCGATSMAQLMRYHEHPAAGIGVRAFTIEVDGVGAQTAYTRGGDGLGGPYAWWLMMLDPDGTILPMQREAIGALCYDAAVAIETSFAAGGSSSRLYDIRHALTNTFGYSSARYGYNAGNDLGTALHGMINCNLDAGYPVLLGIRGPAGGHGIVADGYGYSASTLYHHLNMGWDGWQDAWYNLPTVDSSPSFNTVDGCIYNIFVTGSGEIISGRVTDSAGNPLAGVTITATRSSPSATYTATTDSRGIYAVAKVPGSRTYSVVASQAGRIFQPRSVTTGSSIDLTTMCGNRWGIDFADEAGEPPTAFDGAAMVIMDDTLTITLAGSDDGLPASPGVLSYVITALPAHGTLSVPDAGAIAAMPHTLPAGGNQVVYTPASGYIGADSFQFVVNDGGVAPKGGNSAPATISLDVRLLGDADGDGEVSVLDIVMVVTRFSYTPVDPDWDANCDFDGDGEITVLDVALTVNQFGTRAPGH